MLHAFRESFGKYVAIAILGLIAVTFIFFGIDFSLTRTNFAAKVNGENVPILEFERELQQTQNQYQQLYRVELTDDLRRELRRSVVDQMILREALRQQTNSAGYRISEERTAESIRNTPAFQVAGEFSMDAYLSRLNAQGLTPAGYEAMQREQLTLTELQTGIVASTFVTPAEYRRYIELFNERREIAYALFAVEDFLDQVEITDDAVAEYHTANSSLFMSEETVDLEYLRINLASIAETVDITDEQVRDFYEARRERFETAEERKVRHILINVEGDDYAQAEAEAAQIRERLEAGEDFATLASEASDDPGTKALGGDLGWMARGILVGPFEDALYAMEVGEIAGPVETEFGYHILRLDEVRTGQVQPFEAVADELRTELSNEEAAGLFFDRASELADAAFDAHDDLASVADQLTLPLETVTGFTRNGDAERFTNGGPVVDAAFDEEAIVSGRNSGLLELSDDDVAVVRVVNHNPPVPQTLEEVAAVIGDSLAREAAAELASAAAAAFLADLDAGSVVAAAADANAAGQATEQAVEPDGATVEVTETVDPRQALAERYGGVWFAPAWAERTDTSLPSEVLGIAFAQAKPAPGSRASQIVPLADGGEAAVLLLGVEAGQPESVPREQRDQRQQQLADQAAQLEMSAYAAGVRDRASVRVPDEVLNPPQF